MKAILSARMATLAATLLAVSAVAGAGDRREKLKATSRTPFRAEITNIQPAAEGWWKFS